MSRALRAELETLQSEVRAVHLAIVAAESRIPEARAHLKHAEDALAEVQAPLDALAQENRALAEQLRRENGPRPLNWFEIVSLVAISLGVLANIGIVLANLWIR